ncbi:MAG: thermonuclease family protein [Pseudomonadota bacterium]
MKEAVTYGLVFIGLAIIALVWPRSGTSSDNPVHVGNVRHIVDGDTLYLHGVERSIRVWGIDAPEQREKGYKAATDALSRLAYGKRLWCEQVAIDRYDRIVAKCRLGDGRDIGEEMIKQGHAREYCRYSRNKYGTCKPRRR